MIKCDLCKEDICKYKLDFNDSGAIIIKIKNKKVTICFDCAKLITKEFVESQ
ncbi:MAG: hypothetical protein ACFFG0_02820 [Candidatus Thorarchaeota archaeon]